MRNRTARSLRSRQLRRRVTRRRKARPNPEIVETSTGRTTAAGTCPKGPLGACDLVL